MPAIYLTPDLTTGQLVRILSDAPEGTDIHFETGVYHFDLTGAYHGYFAPSNNANGEKRIVFPLLNKKNLHLDGHGSTFLFEDRVFPFILQDSDGILLENFTIDFSFPRYVIAEVASADDREILLKVDAQKYPYIIENGHWAFKTGSEWRTTEKLKFFIDPLGRQSSVAYLIAGDTEDPLFNLAAPLLRTDAEIRGEGLIALIYRPDSARNTYFPGQKLIVSHDENRENDLFFLERSRNVTVRNVEILRGAGMGFIGQLCHNLTFEDVRIHVAEGRDEPVSITADAFHFLHCSGPLTIRNCRVRDTLDDAVNIHGIYTEAIEVGQNSAIVRLGHQEQYGFNPYFPGDEVIVLDEHGERGKLQISASSLISNDTAIALEFTQPTGDVLRIGDFLDLPGRMPEILLEGNEFVFCPRVIVSSPHKTVLRCNRLSLRVHIQISGGVDYWFESACAQDVLIEDNELISMPDRKYPVITAYVNGPRGAQWHRNLRILGNRLTGSDKLLKASGVDGLTVSGNTSDLGDCEITVRGCQNVHIDE